MRSLSRILSFAFQALMVLTVVSAFAQPAHAVSTTIEENGGVNSDSTDGPFEFWGELVYSLNTDTGRAYTFGTDSLDMYADKGSGYVDAQFYIQYFIDVVDTSGVYQTGYDSSGPAGPQEIPLDTFTRVWEMTPQSPAQISSGLRLRLSVETQATGQVIARSSPF